jgi:hypothetical protein
MLKRILLDMFGAKNSGRIRGSKFGYQTSAWALVYGVVLLGVGAAFPRSVGFTIGAVVFGVPVAWQWWVRVASHYSFSDDLRRRP